MFRRYSIMNHSVPGDCFLHELQIKTVQHGADGNAEQHPYPGNAEKVCGNGSAGGRAEVKEAFSMKKFQKLGSLLLAALMGLSLAACGSKAGSTPTQTPSTDAPAATVPAPTPTAEPDDTPSGGKVLVAYFSGSGNTERVAKDIADELGADIFEITPTEPYTSDDLNWTVSGSRVSREHDDESLRDVPLTTTEVENWDEYDTVFIGYPIWWGIAAWPVSSFVKGNDFSGKTVIPFATSASSGMGQSGKLLSEMAGTGDWQDGQRFSSGASGSTVRDWAAGLGL